jgi:protoporphyrinogen oxidase
MADAAVVGAGLLGLAVAQRLRDRGDDVTVFEAAPYPGGLAAAWEVGDLSWDRHYHVILPTDSRTMVLLRSLGLEHEVRWRSARWGLYAGPSTGLRPLTTTRDLLRLPILTRLDRARIAMAGISAAHRGSWESMEDRSARAWLVRRSGRRAFEGFWRPLLESKLGADWPHASAAFVAASARRAYLSRRVDHIGVLPGGYWRLLERLVETLSDSGVKIETGVPVRSVVPAPANGRARLEVRLDDASARFDRVVVTTAAPLAATLCSALSEREQERLRAVRYIGVVCPSLLLPYRLSPYLQTYVGDPTSPFSTVVETSPFADGRRSVVYLPAYAPAGDPIFEVDDEEIRDRFVAHLRTIHPGLRAGDVEACRISRVRQVFAIPTVGYSKTMPRTTTSIPGLQTIGSANLPFENFNVNDSLGLLQELR